jgi:hypothetical protein
VGGLTACAYPVACVQVMSKRTFFLASVLLAFVAFAVHGVGREQLVASSHRKAKRLETAVTQHIDYTPDPEAVRLDTSGRALNKVGLLFTFSSLACVIVAIIRRESGWYSIPIMLLLADVTVQMLL